MAAINWRTINIDSYDPDSAINFPLETLTPAQYPDVSASEAQQVAGQIRQLLRGGDAEGALRGVLENAPYGGGKAAKDVHLATVVEVLQSIKASEMSPLLSRVFKAPGGSELLDTLMKYLYKGMSQTSSSSNPRPSSPQVGGFSQIGARNVPEGGGQSMSVLLSWHEKVVEVAGPGCIVRVMTDRRTV